jgi:hypothetical protein
MQTALWVYVRGDDPRAIAGIATRVTDTLAARLPSGVRMEGPAGDGALVLRMARLARQIVLGGLGILLALIILVAATSGPRTASSCLVGAVATSLAGVGWLSLMGIALDLVSITCLTGTTLASALAVAMDDREPSRRLAAVLGVVGLVALLSPIGAVRVLTTVTALAFACGCLLGDAVRGDRAAVPTLGNHPAADAATAVARAVLLW